MKISDNELSGYGEALAGVEVIAARCGTTIEGVINFLRTPAGAPYWKSKATAVLIIQQKIIKEYIEWDGEGNRPQTPDPVYFEKLANMFSMMERDTVDTGKELTDKLLKITESNSVDEALEIIGILMNSYDNR